MFRRVDNYFLHLGLIPCRLELFQCHRGITTTKDKFSEANRETGSLFRKARYNLDSCASRIADMTDESMKARFRMTISVTASGTKLLPPSAAADCVVGISPVGFLFYKLWNFFHGTVHKEQNGFRRGGLVIGLVPFFLSSLTAFF